MLVLIRENMKNITIVYQEPEFILFLWTYIIQTRK